jgi:Uma2 family endonuclease
MAAVLGTPTQDRILTDAWIQASWQEFQTLANMLEYAKGRFYYDQGSMRIEMAALGPIHGRDNAVVARLVSLFATVKGIRILEFTNTSFTQKGIRECQPDSSFYIGNIANLPPRNHSAVDLNLYEPSTLVLEIASTTLSDDLGAKRLLYERLGVKEYWVVNTAASSIIAFEILNGGSREIRASMVLPSLEISVVEQALQWSQTTDDGEVNRWLLQCFSQSDNISQ